MKLVVVILDKVISQWHMVISGKKETMSIIDWPT